MQKKVLYLVLGLIIILLGFWLFQRYQREEKILPTYFTYTQSQLTSLKGLTTHQKITSSKLKRWDEITFDLIRKNKLGDKDAARILAYLYTGQREVAFLSFNHYQEFEGSINPISIKVLCLFLSKDCETLTKMQDPDPYSNVLAQIVFTQLNERFIAEKNSTHLYPEKIGSEYWKGESPYFGQDVGSWKTWFLKSSHEFRAPPPPSPNDKTAWQKQVNLTKTALNSITPTQTKAVVFWAGGPGTITPPGQWLTLGNDYMWSSDVPLSKVFLVRSVLAMGIEDAVIAVFDSKYTYWVKRPFMRDKSIQTIMPTPNHPSYPAGHSTISAAAATILTYYFPKEKNYWMVQAQEAANSRMWGGIHFSIDDQQGFSLGEKVANQAIAKAQHEMAQ